MQIAVRHSDERGIESPSVDGGKGGVPRNQAAIRFLLSRNDDLESSPILPRTRPQEGRVKGGTK